MTERKPPKAPASDTFADRIDDTGPVSTPEAEIFAGATGTDAPETIEPLLETVDLQAIFPRSDRTLRRWIAAGHLKPIRIGGAVFYHPADVRALIAKRLRR